MTTVAVIAIVAFFGLLLCVVSYRAGKAQQSGAIREKTHDDVEKALLARDRLRHDPDFANSVRERFSR